MATSGGGGFHIVPGGLDQKQIAKLLASGASPADIQAMQNASYGSNIVFGGSSISNGISPLTITGIHYGTSTPSQPPQMKKSKFKVGDKVLVVTNGYGIIEGVIGEIMSPDTIFVWHHVQMCNGSSGKIPPQSKGFPYSWQCAEKDLNLIAAKPEPKKEFIPANLDPLIIEKSVKEEIIAVLKQYKHFDKLFTEWGLGSVIEYGRGMTFMFYGSPGTGKTWGAHCIAKSLGSELLIISAAEIQSSEPGGANRAIKQAFEEAKESNKVLFLDECDSLISSRKDLGMVLASEVNTLLTEIEKFEGVLILATNRIEHMDEALERRISLIVEFPKPNYESRVLIWDKLLPDKLPLGEGVEIPLLAKEKLTGGQIKNVVLQAARLALAGEHKKVELTHFESAIERIKKSKDIMGTASRYRQGGDDYSTGMSVGKGHTEKFKAFLDDIKTE